MPLATIPNGSSLSNSVMITPVFNPHEIIYGLYIPAVDSCTIYIQASMDNINFSRVLKTDGTGDWNIASTTGDRCIFIDQLAPFHYFRIETSVNQTANRTFIFDANY